MSKEENWLLSSFSIHVCEQQCDNAFVEMSSQPYYIGSMPQGLSESFENIHFKIAEEWFLH